MYRYQQGLNKLVLLSSIALLSLIMLACHGLEYKGQLDSSPSLPSSLQQQSFIQLEDLNQESSKNLWEQFFNQQDAHLVWEALKEPHKTIEIEFHQLKMVKKSLPGAKYIIDEIVKGVIQYLSYHNPTVENLILTEGHISNLPKEVGNLINLKLLELTDNQLEELPIEIGKLLNLRELRLDNNKLRKLPLELGYLTHLNYLSFTNNPLVELPPSLSKLTQLYCIELCHNQLTVLPASLISKIETDPVADINDLGAIEQELVEIDLSTLANYFHQKLPPSLLEICQKYVAELYNQATSEQRKIITNKLPFDFNSTVLNKKLYDCPLMQDKRILYFYEVRFEEEPSENYTIPLYWDTKLHTTQDLENMLKVLKGKKAFLIPESYFR